MTTAMACVSFAGWAALAASADLGVTRTNTWVLWVLAGVAIVLALAAATAPSTFEGRGAVAFVVVADVAIAVGLSAVSDETLSIVGCSLFMFVGAFAALLVGRAAILAHVAISSACLVVVAAAAHPGGRTTILLSLATWLALGVPVAVRALWRDLRPRAQLAFTDPLTGAANRAGLERNFVSLRALAHRRGLAVAVVIADIDRFKSVNDVHGHAIGDAVIGEAARILFHHFGAGATVARHGGEEFTVLVAGHPGDLRYRVASLPTATQGEQGPQVTMSVGAAWCRVDVESTDCLWRAVGTADAAMYEAKAHGGNSCVSRL
ncbi:GGDEF domain-containing protein [uncultured Williamsia sp.]|uniref:GGDEF domain-containing protein n=1 Tax=uncultured Williamsia sp. TaxID=259311 RepID=UPI00260F559A|nr:GGDEF domain-containing protein [uncultured Williamsia sp.]